MKTVTAKRMWVHACPICKKVIIQEFLPEYGSCEGDKYKIKKPKRGKK
jgi:hypothetical protein